jgi:hypothetical protein
VRFAGLPRVAKQLIGYGLPGDLGEAVGRFGPDLAFSALYAGTVPGEYANPMERIALGAEDLATQAVPGVLAAGLGGTIARRMGANRRLAGQIAGGVDMAASIGVPMFAQQMGLRPFASHLDERARKNAELQAQMEREGIFQQGLNAAADRFGNSPMIQGLDGAFGGYG